MVEMMPAVTVGPLFYGPHQDRLPGPHQVSLEAGQRHRAEGTLGLVASAARWHIGPPCPAPLAGVHVVSTATGGAVEVTRPSLFAWATGDLTFLPAAALP